MKEEIVKISEATEQKSMLQVIADVANNPNVNVAVMKDLVELQFRIMDEEKQQALNKALAILEPQLTTLVKSKLGAKTKDGKIKFYYTPYEDIDKMIRKPLRDCGLSLSFTTRIIADKPYFVTQVQEITKGGIKESMIPYAPDVNDQLNAPQKVASGLSYSERYGVKLLFNLVFEGEDDNADAVGTIASEQVTEISQWLNDTNSDETKFKAYIEKEFGAKSFSEIQKKDFPEIIALIKNKGRARK